MEQLEELRLVKQAKKGDVEAFGRLYGAVYKDLYRFAVFMLKDSLDAEDVVSETVTAAFAGIGKLKKEEAFKGWIFRILTNQCKRVLKGYATKPDMQEYEDRLFSELDGETGREDILDLHRAFGKLEDEDRVIVGLSFFGGYNSQEIAQMLDTKPGTVRSRQSRALAKMRAELSGTYGW